MSSESRVAGLGIRLVTVDAVLHVTVSRRRRSTAEPAESPVVTGDLRAHGDQAVTVPGSLSAPATQAAVADPQAATEIAADSVTHANAVRQKALKCLRDQGLQIRRCLAQTTPIVQPLLCSDCLTAQMHLQAVMLLLLLTGVASACCTRCCPDAQTASAAAVGCSRSGCWPAWALGPAP